MEPLTVAIALGTIVATKAAEKVGENAGDKLSLAVGKVVTFLKRESPQTAIALESAPEQPLDYGQAVLELEAIAAERPELQQAIQELTAAAQTEPPSNLSAILQEMSQQLQSQSSQNQISVETIEKILNFAQRDINIQQQTINF